MKVEIGNYEVVSSGTIIGVVNEPIIFHIEDLIFEIVFIDNKEDKEQRIFPVIPPDGKKMTITFQNFNNGLGTGSTKPFNVGFINDKTLSFNYRIYSLTEEAGKLLHYTWLLKKEEGGQNGK